MVQEAKEFFKAHGEPFNEKDWLYIAQDLGGKLPLRIRAVPEGTVVPTKNVLMTVESTDSRAYWLPSWMETQLMRVWYPTTVATVSWHAKRAIRRYLEETSDQPELAVETKLHDFGARGVSSRESTGIGGAAHLVNFKGSDSVIGVFYANHYYHSDMAGFSIPAAEHSTITSYGRKGEADAYRNMLDHFAKPGNWLAIVSDSYDIYHAISHIFGETLKQQIIDSGAYLVIRPDSGDPVEIVVDSLRRLDASFGSVTNKKGFRVLNQVRVLQGDGITESTIGEILSAVKAAGYSADNVGFGMGGGLLQKVDRDTQKFAYKCSSITIDGKDVDVFKDPITDPGKTSKKGKLDLVELGKLGTPTYSTVVGTGLPHSALRTVYENGEILIDETLEIIRQRSNQ